MVPASYHEFFSGCASVAGALVGLLFVAISISPEKLSDPAGAAAFQIRAGAAFSALLNALVVTLFALLPQTNLGTVALFTSISGIASTTGLVTIQLRESTGARPREIVLVVALVAVFVTQLVTAVELRGNPRATGAVQTEAMLVVVCFLLGIARAWELLGVRRTGLVHAAISLSRPRPPGGPARRSGRRRARSRLRAGARPFGRAPAPAAFGDRPSRWRARARRAAAALATCRLRALSSAVTSTAPPM